MSKRGRPKGGKNAEPLKGSATAKVVEMLRAGTFVSVSHAATTIGCAPSTVVEAIKRWSKEK